MYGKIDITESRYNSKIYVALMLNNNGQFLSYAILVILFFQQCLDSIKIKTLKIKIIFDIFSVAPTDIDPL